MRARRIAFDYGDSRIGVAICDPDGILATPLDFLSTKSPHLKKELTALFDEYQPIRIFLGRPKLLSGDDGTAVEKVEIFAELLKSLTEIEIVFVDERLTTTSAARLLRDAGKDAKASRSLIDSAAAVAILEIGLQHEDR
jgi:putative Holliday junction resolvase